MPDSLEPSELFKNLNIHGNPIRKAGNSQGKKTFHNIPRKKYIMAKYQKWKTTTNNQQEQQQQQ